MDSIKRTTASTRFSSFQIHTTPYKRIGTHTIDANFLIPKTLKPGKSPLLVKFHGGGLVLGDALYPDWFGNYFVDLVHRNNAIIVAPNYRLTPDHSGDEILEDIRDFWKWVDEELVNYITSIYPSIELDVNKLLVSGESAGGWMSLHSLFHLPQDRIKSMILQFPMTKKLNGTERSTPIDPAVFPESIITDYLASITPGNVVSSATPRARIPLLMALGAHMKYFDERFGTGKHLQPADALESAKYFPPTLILQGEQDTLVPVSQVRHFVDEIERVHGKQVRDQVRLVVKDGDHGFDNELVEEDTPWLKEELGRAEKAWLA